jgi:hypothetical protein
MKLETNSSAVLLSATLALTFVVACGNQVSTPNEDRAGTTAKAASEPPSRQDATKSVEEDVDKQVDSKLRAEKQKVYAEAVEALAATDKALLALDQEKPKRALSLLETATGKLEILIARYPSLALAPVNIETTTQELITTVDAVEEAREQAEELLENGEIQQARSLLATMVSEVNLRVTNVPLASYPEAIKTVAALIDDNELDKAKRELALALGTLVITNYTIPLPITRAGALVGAAETITGGEEIDKEDQERLTGLLDTARYELQFARALGYGEQETYEEIFAEIDQLEERATAPREKSGLFGSIKKKVTSLADSLYAAE